MTPIRPPNRRAGALRESQVHDPGAMSAEEAESYGAADDEADDDGSDDDYRAESGSAAEHADAAAPRRPFAELPSLPADVSDAFESFKLCILRHKLAGWGEISRGDMLAALDALKELALAAPAE